MPSLDASREKLPSAVSSAQPRQPQPILTADLRQQSPPQAPSSSRAAQPKGSLVRETESVLWQMMNDLQFTGAQQGGDEPHDEGKTPLTFTVYVDMYLFFFRETESGGPDPTASKASSLVPSNSDRRGYFSCARRITWYVISCPFFFHVFPLICLFRGGGGRNHLSASPKTHKKHTRIRTSKAVVPPLSDA